MLLPYTKFVRKLVVFIDGVLRCDDWGSCEVLSLFGALFVVVLGVMFRVGDSGGNGGMSVAVGSSRDSRMVSSGSLGGETFGGANCRVLHRFVR